MNRQQKETVVSGLREMLAQSNASFLVQYKGLNVGKLQDLRRKLKTQDASLKITKARLMKIATSELPESEDFKGNLKDQVGLIFAKKEPNVIAKTIVDFSRENENLKIVAGYYELKSMSKEQVAWFASIPSREVLLAQLVSLFQAPIAQFVSTVDAVVEKMSASGDNIEKGQE